MDKERKKRRLFQVFAGVLGCGILGLAVLQQVIMRQSVAAFQAVIHTGDVLFEAEQLISGLKDVEAGQRGFTLTGSDTYLEAFHTGLSLLTRAQTNLLDLTRHNPQQLARLHELETLVNQRLHMAGELIELRREHGLSAAVSAMTGAGRQKMNEVRAVVRAIQGEERRVMQERREHSDKMVRWSRFLTFMILAVLAGVSLWTIWLSRRLARLKELVTICAWTGQVKVGAEWVSLERFLREKMGIATTHGISEKAAAELTRELGGSATANAPGNAG